MSLFVFGGCRNCGKNCIWMPMVDGVLAFMECCSSECLQEIMSKLEEEEITEKDEELTEAKS